jgi:molybdopterin molybdotransferase
VNELFTVVPPGDALDMLLTRCARVERSETIALADALGRVTAQELRAAETLPAFARSTMDGYAVIAADTFGASESAPAYLRLCGEVRMGIAPALRVEPLGAARIHTGAMLPAGADAVVMVEDTNAHGDEIEILAAAAPGENIVAVGEDVTAGSTAVPAGRRLRAQDLGGLAALGCTTPRVCERPRIAILSTGDEVVEPGATPGVGQVRDVNATTIGAVVTSAGGIPVHAGIVGDDLPRLEAAARDALLEADALVLSAGSSVSFRDLTARVVESLGPPGIFVHGIAIKPGKPTLIAFAGSKPVIGLPGNPASALVVAWRLLGPLVRRLGGETTPAADVAATIDARLTGPVRSRPGREDFIPCRLTRTANGEVTATPIFGKSNLIFTLVRADGLIVVPLDVSGVPADATVRVIVP